ncbi:MAG: hypothetical protein A3E74_08575 [Omnitrophica bacterium RIFCSPHIGHO2_12_FULL_44_12]|nr:MAG: hypothetical protein A3E74_08575 [Omnitrophica bacterium RIFCSPHIGHO2_12_FULL_44_12]
MIKIIKLSIVVSILLIVSHSSIFADNCTIPFHDGLEDQLSVNQNGGVINGNVTFVTAANGNGANFDGTGTITYTNPMFNSESGSVSLFFKKTTADAYGGILQIGLFAAANSMGLFYNFGTNIYFEMKNSVGTSAVAYAENKLSQTQFTHIVVTWDKRDAGFAIKLFLDGKYIKNTGGQLLTGSFVLNPANLILGKAGPDPWYGNGRGLMDEVRFFNWMLSDAEVYAEYVYASNKFIRQETERNPSTGPIRLDGKNLYVNEQLFKVKGIGYQPVPHGLSNTRTVLDQIYKDDNILNRDIPLLRSMGVNTVSLWAELPDGEKLLDKLYNGGDQPIYAIMAFEVPLDIDYTDPTTIATYRNNITTYVNKFKGKSAVLAWGIGNETNLHYTGNLGAWYFFANELADAAYLEETANNSTSYHPTMVSNSGMLDFGNVDNYSDDISLNHVDMWGHNAYVKQNYHCYFDYYDKISAKPLIITEYGIDAWNTVANHDYPEVQAEWNKNFWLQMTDQCIGGTLMAYSDEWWKNGTVSFHNTGGHDTDVQPDNRSDEEWYGVMEIEDNLSAPDIMLPRKTYCSLKAEFADFAPPDFDRDGDVDQEDFGHFQVCYTGSGTRPTYDCYDSDFDCDHDVDLDDFGYFLNCDSGPMIPVASACWDVFRGTAAAPHPTSLSFNPEFDNDQDGFDTSVDCNDANPNIHPNAQEICNQADDNCDGTVDESNVCVIPDSDKDGILDPDDECPKTPAGAKIDQVGCSASQFCGKITITSWRNQLVCVTSDWKDNERKKLPLDCQTRWNGRSRKWLCENTTRAN